MEPGEVRMKSDSSQAAQHSSRPRTRWGDSSALPIGVHGDEPRPDRRAQRFARDQGRGWHRGTIFISRRSPRSPRPDPQGHRGLACSRLLLDWVSSLQVERRHALPAWRHLDLPCDRLGASRDFSIVSVPGRCRRAYATPRLLESFFPLRGGDTVQLDRCGRCFAGRQERPDDAEAHFPRRTRRRIRRRLEAQTRRRHPRRRIP